MLISLISPIHTVRRLGPTLPMITIKSSSASDNPSLPPEGSPDGSNEELKKRIPLVWIPATLVVGLLIAAIYLGGRIVKAHPSASPSAPPSSVTSAVVQKATPPAPPTEPAVASPVAEPPAPPAIAPRSEPLTVVTPDDGIPMITPKTGQRYIQVGALDQEATRRFVQRLRSEKLDPHVATGPTPQLMRVLIGPFDNSDALNERKAQLETEGIDTFVREY
jgi:cell division septation protein DedD